MKNEEGRRKKEEKNNTKLRPSSLVPRLSSLVSRPSSGFTLVELLVAVVVIAVGMVFVLGALGQCMNALTTAQKTARANYLLSQKIWSIDEERQLNGGSQEGAWNGIFEEPYADYNWTDEVRMIDEDFGNETVFIQKYLNEETLKVVWRQGRAGKDISITRYVAKKLS